MRIERRNTLTGIHYVIVKTERELEREAKKAKAKENKKKA